MLFKVFHISCQYWGRIYWGRQKLPNLRAKKGIFGRYICPCSCVCVSFCVCVCVYVCVSKSQPHPNTCFNLMEKKQHFFLKADTLLSETRLSQMEMSWIKSHPSCIKPQQPRYLCSVLHGFRTCSFHRRMLSPSLVHWCCNYWERGWSVYHGEQQLLFPPGICVWSAWRQLLVPERWARGGGKGSWDHRFIISRNNTVCKIWYVPSGGVGNRREGRASRVCLLYIFHIIDISQTSVLMAAMSSANCLITVKMKWSFCEIPLVSFAHPCMNLCLGTGEQPLGAPQDHVWITAPPD